MTHRDLCVSVDEPCVTGCKNLQYCTHFTRDPLQLYRSCNRAADKAARQDIQLWERGVISLPMMQDIPVKGKTPKFSGRARRSWDGLMEWSDVCVVVQDPPPPTG